MNILFICKHNRGRSKVAEAIFAKLIGKKKGIQTKSAGVMLDLMRPYVEKSVHETMAKKRFKIKDEIPKAIDENAIKWADKIIIVANNVSPDLFPKEKVEVWDVKDGSASNPRDVERIIDDVEARVRKLVKGL